MNEEMERNELGVTEQTSLPVQPEPVTPEAAAPIWAEPVQVEPVFFIKPVRKVFSRIGWALSTILLAATVAQVLMILIPQWLWGPENWLSTSSWGMWITMLVPMYFVAMPLCILIMQGMPAEKPRDAKLGAGNFFVFFCIFYFFTYAGNIIGTVLSALLSGGTAQNEVSELAMDNNPLKIVVMVILAPLLEELICRKLIIDRTRKYGEKIAVVLSGLTFGLLHGNLFQFFYAFAGGMLMGYIYIRTGRLRYTVLIHVIMNFMGAVIAPFILTSVDMELLQTLETTMPTEEMLAVYQQILPGLLLLMGYSLLLIGVSITGLVFFIIKCKKLVWLPAEKQLPKGKCFKTVYLNAGMIVFFLLCIASMVSALF